MKSNPGLTEPLIVSENLVVVVDAPLLYAISLLYNMWSRSASHSSSSGRSCSFISFFLPRKRFTFRAVHWTFSAKSREVSDALLHVLYSD